MDLYIYIYTYLLSKYSRLISMSVGTHQSTILYYKFYTKYNLVQYFNIKLNIKFLILLFIAFYILFKYIRVPNHGNIYNYLRILIIV